MFLKIFIDIDECSENTDNCEQVCSNTPGSFNCSCNEGYVLADNGYSCTVTCGGNLTGSSGSFQTPGWPNSYPQEDFQCEWISDPSNSSNARIEFTIDDSSYGINGMTPCSTDYIQFFDGTGSNAVSLHKLCKFDNPGPFVTSTSQARVVFFGTADIQSASSKSSRS